MNPSDQKAKPPETKQKALCVATRCSTVDQFIATFHRFCDETSFFVATLATRPVGLETAFSIQLEDKTPVLRGLCVVVEAWSTPANRFGRPGVRLNVRRLTNDSLPVFKQLQAARVAAEADAAKPGDAAVATSVVPIATTLVDTKPIVTRPLGIPPAVPAVTRKAEGAPAIPKISPTAFAAKPDPPRPDASATAKPDLATRLAAAKPSATTVRGEIRATTASSAASVTASGATASRGSSALSPTPAASVVSSDSASPSSHAAPTLAAIGIAASASTAPAVSSPVASTTSTAASDPVNGVPREGAATSAAASSTPPAAISHPVNRASRDDDGEGDGDPPARVVGRKPLDVAPPISTRPSTSLRPARAAVVDKPTNTAPPLAVRADGTSPIARAASPAGSASLVPQGPTVTTPAIGISTSTLNLSNTGRARSDVPEAIAPSDDMTSPVASEARAPGSSFVLPANPLMNLSDTSLEGFIDCALYEETGNFYRTPGYEESLVDLDDPVAQPPLPAVMTAMPIIRPDGEVSQMAFLGPPTLDPGTTNPPPFQSGPLPRPGYVTGQMVPVYATQPVQPYATGPMQAIGQPYPTGQLAYPLQTPYPTGQLAHEPVPNAAGKRWLAIGGAAVLASLVLLVIIVATRGDDKTASASPPIAQPAQAPVKPMTVEPAERARVATAPTKPSAAPGEIVEDDVDPPADPNVDPDAPPVVGTGPCSLTVTTTPAGSIVRVDDQVVGPSPVTLQRACARVKVEAKHPRYAPGVKWATLAADAPQSVDLPMSRPTHALTIVSQPAGATVSIAGRRAGTTPTQVKVMGFTTVTLTIEKKGYRPQVEKIYSRADGKRRMVTLLRGK